jgi:hypothetical protein
MLAASTAQIRARRFQFALGSHSSTNALTKSASLA